jgi:hypothetical protein
MLGAARSVQAFKFYSSTLCASEDKALDEIIFAPRAPRIVVEALSEEPRPMRVLVIALVAAPWVRLPLSHFLPPPSATARFADAGCWEMWLL